MSPSDEPRRGPFPRLILAAAASGSGKTTIALGVVAALRNRGLTVGAAKTGPDFIDAAHLARAAGSVTRNLDAWLAPPQTVRTAFVRASEALDVTIVEGAMGLFDGRHGSGEGSSAHLARLLDAPVVLVLDCAHASTTIGAIALGLVRFDPRVRVAGAILNRIASDAHAATVRDACARAGVTVLGVVPRDERLAIESRHLGLHGPHGDEWLALRDAAAATIAAHVDLDALLAIARSAPPLERAAAPKRDNAPRVRVAIPRDEAFWFYDEASLDALRDAGAELVAYDALAGSFPNDVGAAYVGGGYPELHAAALAANRSAREGLRRALDAGMPAYAECGGLMYLGEALEADGATHAMVGAIASTATMLPRRSRLRYVEADAVADGPMFRAGERVRGHEFHYSQTRYAREAPAYRIGDEREGHLAPHLHASYVHVHLGGHAAAAERFVARAVAFRGRA